MVELLHVVAHECEDLAHVMAPLLTTMSTMKNYADILDDVDMLCEIMLEEEGDDCLEMDQKATLGRMILGVLATKSDLAEQPDESQLRTQSKKGHEAEKHTEATLTVGNKMPKLLSLFKADVAALTPLVGCLSTLRLGPSMPSTRPLRRSLRPWPTSREKQVTKICWPPARSP